MIVKTLSAGIPAESHAEARERVGGSECRNP
jgi:hypothetical protein